MLSNTATPKYYKQFRDAVIRGEIPVNRKISLEMNRIDGLIADKRYYFDQNAVEGWIAFCESEMTLVDGSDFFMLDSFKLWGEEIFGWFYFIDRSVWNPNGLGQGRGCYEQRKVKQRLVNRQYIITGRGSAKTMYDSCIQFYSLVVDTSTTVQCTTAPTMAQADEVLGPIRTAIARARGPLLKMLTLGSLQNTTGSKKDRQKLAATKKGIQNFITNSLLEIRPMSIDKLQGRRDKVSTVDEWLSGEIRENPINALAQGASKNTKNNGWIIVATSSEGTVRNGIGDTIKMDLEKILKGEIYDPHTSIWWYQLDSIKEVGMPEMWLKANPNIGKTVTWETYELEKEQAENSPADRNDILAKRFGLPMEGYTYFFTYEETKTFRHQDYDGMACSMGCDLSMGGDFCSFTFMFPLRTGAFGIKTLDFISEYTLSKLPAAMREKYQQFIDEGSLVVLNGTVLDMMDVYDVLDRHIQAHQYDIRSVGYDPYNAREFIARWCSENGEFGVEKVIQGAKTESVPLTELKKLAEQRLLIFDEQLFSYTMGNCIVLEDTNGNKKLYKKAYEAKIDAVAALMDAFVAYKLNKESFE